MLFQEDGLEDAAANEGEPDVTSPTEGAPKVKRSLLDKTLRLG